MRSIVILSLFALTGLGIAPESDALHRGMVASMEIPSSPGRYWKSCQNAPGGCVARLRAFADMFVTAAETHAVDPWTLAAMAYVESRYNPAAKGSVGELGILQLSKHWQKRIPFFKNEKVRARCLKQTDACQSLVVSEAARILARSIDRCGSVAHGLTRYNTGSCGGFSRYQGEVMRRRAWLRSLAGLDGEA